MNYKCFSKVIKKLDMYPQKFTFYLKDGEENKRTISGSLLSLILIISSIYIIGQNAYIFLYSNTPTILASTEFTGSENVTTINPSKIKFLEAFASTNTKGVSGFNFNQTDSSIINSYVNFNLINVSNSQILNRNLGNFTKCSKKYTEFGELGNSLYETLKGLTNSTYCNNNYENFMIGGNPILTHTKTVLKFNSTYNLCNTDSLEFINRSNCKNSTFLSVYPMSLFLIHNDFFVNMTNPLGFEEFLKVENIPLQMDKDVKIILTFRRNILYTDINLIYEILPKEELIYYIYNQISYSYSSRKSPEMLSVSFELELDNYQNVFERTYMKIDQVFANILSIYSMIDITLAILMSLLEFGTLEYYLMRRLYYFDSDDEDDCYPHKTKSIKRISIKKKGLDFQYLSNIDRAQSMREDVSKGKSNIQIELDESGFKRTKNWKKIIKGKYFPKKNFKLLFYQSLPCCKHSSFFTDVNYFNAGLEIIKHDMNIVNILKKLLEFESLKKVLFDDNQASLFKVLYARRIRENMNTELYIDKLNNEMYNLKQADNEKINIISSAFILSKDSENVFTKRMINNIKYQ